MSTDLHPSSPAPVPSTDPAVGRANLRFALGVALFVGLGVAGVLGFREFGQAQQLRTQTFLVLDQLGEVRQALLDVETGALSFVLSGTPEDLEPYEAGRRAVGPALARLRALTTDNPGQQGHLTELESLAQARLTAAEQFVQVRRAEGLDAAQELRALGVGRRTMDDVRQALAGVEKEERRLLGVREAARRRVEWQVLAMLLFVAAFLTFRREQRRRAAAEVVRQQFNAELEARVTQRTSDLEGVNQSLASVQARLRLIIETEPECVKVVSPRGELLEMNAAGLTMLDAASLAEVTGQPLLHYIVPEHQKAFVALHREVMAGHAGVLEFETIGLRGTRRWLETHAVPLRDAAGTVTGLLGVTREVTAQKCARAAFAASEERYRLLAEHADDFVMVFGLEGAIFYISPSYYRVTGWTRADLEATDWRARMHPDDLPAIERVRAANRAGEATTLEHRVRCRDGRWVWVEARCKPLVGADGQAMQFLLWSRDITERKQAEAALGEAESRLRLSVSASNIGLWDWNLATNEVYYSREWKGQLGYAEHELANRFDEWESRVHPEDLAPTLAKVREFIANPAAEYAVEFRLRHKDGAYRWMLTQAQIFRDAEGRPFRIMGCHVDITHRMRTETALRESEARFRAFVRASADVLYRMSPDWQQMYHLDGRGFIVDTLKPNSTWLQEYIHPDDQPQVMAVIQEAIRTKSIFKLEHRVRRVDGTLGWTNSCAIPLLDAQGEITEWFGAASDVTQRRQAEEALQESEARFAAAFRANPAGVSLSTLAEGRFLDVNPAFLKMFGLARAQVVGRTSVELGVVVSAEVRRKIVETLRRTGFVRDLEMPFQRPDGSICHTLRSVERLVLGGEECLLTLIVDTTDRKLGAQQLEESREQLRALLARLQRAQEGERTRVSREIHDELGQLLTGLKMDLRWLERKLSEPGLPSALTPLLDRAVAASELADATIATVQKIAAELRPALLDNLGLGAALQQRARIFQERTGTSCALVVEACPGLPHASAGELFYICQEALTNVTRHAQATHVEIHLRPEGDTIVLKVRDDGVGLAEAELHAPRSLGLLGMRERAVQCGGTLTFTRNELRGTCLTVRVPRVNEAAASAKGAGSYQPGATLQVSDHPGAMG